MRYAYSLMAAVLMALPGSADAADKRQKLYVLLLIDTDASRIGGNDDIHRPSHEADLKNLRGVIDQVVEKQPGLFKDRVAVTVLKGIQDLQPDKIKKTLRDFPTDEHSTVFVYYSGHSAIDKQRGHYFAMSGGRLPRADILEILVVKKLRAGILISDCCSSFDSFSPPKRGPAKSALFNNLFFESHGLIDITAATESQLAWCNSVHGGFFTNTLTRTLCTSSGEVREDGEADFVTWETLFLKVRHETEQTFLKAKKEAKEDHEIKKADAQTPQAFSLGDERVVYTDRKGFFRALDGSTWVEDWGDGKTIINWEEKGRTTDYVEVYDPSRDMRMRLQDGGSIWRKESEPQKWFALPDSNGKWDTGRTAFISQLGYTWRVGGDLWIGNQTSDPKFVSRARETARTREYVEMYDKDRKMYVRFYKDKGVWSLDRENWQPWKGSDGYWLLNGKD